MSHPPRVLLCSFDVVPSPTGSSRRLLDYLRGLQDHFPSDVLSVKTPDHSHIERLHGARLLRVPVGSGDFASRIQAFERAVRRQLESEDYGIVHFTDPFGGYVLCEARAEHGYRLVYDALSFPSHELRFTHPHLEGDRRFLARVRRQELFCLLNADAVITGSGVTRDFLQGLGVEEDSIHLLPTASDLDGVVTPVRKPQPGAPLRVAYVGSQVGWQGLTALLRAVAHASEQVEVRLTLVGPKHPDWQPPLESLAAELQLSHRIEFLAPVPHAEVGKVLAAADVCVVPLDDAERNRSPGGPVGKIADYLAAGRAIVSVDLPITRELLPEACTRFVPPRDAEALGDALVSLARDPARRREMGVEARKSAEALRSPTEFRSKIRSLYGALLERRSEPQPEVASSTRAPSTDVTPTPDRDSTLVAAEPGPPVSNSTITGEAFDESAFAPTLIRRVPLTRSEDAAATRPSSRKTGETRRSPSLTSKPIPKDAARAPAAPSFLEDEPTFADASPLNERVREEGAPQRVDEPSATTPAEVRLPRATLPRAPLPPGPGLASASALRPTALPTRSAEVGSAAAVPGGTSKSVPTRGTVESNVLGSKSTTTRTPPEFAGPPKHSAAPSTAVVTPRLSTPPDLAGPPKQSVAPSGVVVPPRLSTPPPAPLRPTPSDSAAASPPPLTSAPPARVTTAHFEAASSLLPPPLPDSSGASKRLTPPALKLPATSAPPTGAAAVVTNFPPAVPPRPSRLLLDALKATGATLPPAYGAPPVPMLVGDDDVEEITGEGEPALVEEITGEGEPALLEGLIGESARVDQITGEGEPELLQELHPNREPSLVDDWVEADVAHRQVSADDASLFETADDSVLPDSQASAPPATPLPPGAASSLAPSVPDAEELDESAYEESEATRSLPPCSLAPWLAQLLHGYCPPEGIDFNRPPPPTTFPGRDEPPGPTSPRLSPGSSGTNLT